MFKIVVESCNVISCQHYRVGDKCAKNGMWMPSNLNKISFSKNDKRCEIQHKINELRLNNLLENEEKT